MKYGRNILTGCSFFLMSVVTAQQISYRHFSTNEGLPHPQIYMTKTGPDGSLWIGTDNGLSRFDGNRFYNFYSKSVTGTNYILDMDSLPGGLILINAYKGGLCLLRNDSVVHIPVDTSMLPPNHRFEATRLYSVKYDPFNKCVWVITSARLLFRIVYTEKKLVVYPVSNKPNGYFSIYISEKLSTVFFATAKGLYTYQPATGVIPLPGNPVNSIVYRIFEKNDTELILGLQDGLLTWNHSTGTTEINRYAPARLKYEGFLYDSKQQLLWIPGYEGGIFVFNNPRLHRPYLHLLKGTTPNFLYADPNNNVWCGTYGSGLYLFQQTYILNYQEQEGLEDSYITHIGFEKDSVPLVSCLRTFYRFNNKSRYFNTLLKTNETDPNNKTVALPNGGFVFVNKGRIMNSSGYVLNKLLSVVYDVQPYNRDTFILGHYSGLLFTNAAFKEIKGSIELPNINVFMVRKTGDSLLMPSSKGLCIYYNGNLTMIDEKNGLGDGYVHTVLVVKDIIYCGTRTGLFSIDKTGQVKHAWKQFLVGEDIRHLSADENGGIWIGTQKGLYLQTNNRLYHFDSYDGFAASEITTLLIRNNQLYAGTVAGLSVVNLNRLYNNLQTPVVRKAPEIEKLIINGREVNLIAREIPELQPNENNIVIRIKNVQFNPQQQMHLEYSLDNGVTWNVVINREINLKSLNYGSYTLLVRTRHRNETTGDYMMPFRFSIKLPWYRNVLLIIAISLLCSAIVAWFYNRITRNRRERERQQLALKKQMLDLEQKAMAALLNPHFVFNAINSINYYINNREEEKYTRLLTDLSKLIRLNLNNTYKDSVTLESELEIVALYVAFEKHRFIRQSLQFEVIYESRLQAKDVKIPSMIIQPFVENAIWHGLLPKNGGRVWLHIKDGTGNYLQVAIHDDGVGAKPLGEDVRNGEVRGIRLIQERIAAYNQLNKQPIKLFFPGKETLGGTGFCVQLSFPLQQEIL
jgi:ligand-binding sensor domain-containing protein